MTALPTGPGTPGSFSHETDAGLAREALVARFEAWLDEVLAPEPPPRGVPPELLEEDDDTEGAMDLNALWAATTALTQEIRLQGRSFKSLSDTLEHLPALAPRVEDVLEAHGEAIETAHDLARDLAEEVRALGETQGDRRTRDARAGADGRLLDVLLDVRDRLARGILTARELRTRHEETAKPRGWVARLGRRLAGEGEDLDLAPLKSLEEGYAMGLARLDATLEELQVGEIPAHGRPFDPRCMNAIEVEETDSVPRGTVVEVFRPGYTWRGEIHRPAQVKVARPAAPKA